MQKVNAGLDVEIDGANVEKEKPLLMQCMLHIRDVRCLMREELLVNFAILKDFVALLKLNGIALDMSYVGKENVLVFLEQAPIRWENMVNKTFKKKEVIQPLQNQMMESIRQEVAEFNRRLSVMKEEFKVAAPLQTPSDSRSIADVYEQLDAYNTKLTQVEQEAARLIELEDIFELASSKYDVLTTLRANFTTLKHIWDFVALLDSIYVDKWQPLLWNDLNADELMEEVDELERHRHALFSSARAVKEWPIYTYLEQKLHQMTVILPLVKHLHSPAMRDRHWKNLMVLARKHFDLSGPGGGLSASSYASMGGSTSSGDANRNNKISLRFEEVLKLELFRFVNEVNELVEMATREFKIEQQLQSIETTWNGFQLEFVPYQTAGSKASSGSHGSGVVVDGNDDDQSQSTTTLDAGEMEGDVMILKMPNVIIECLEEHQLQLQTMAATGKFVAYFKDKVFEWLLRLGNVDTILKLWVTLQRQWCSLESIFLSSAGDIQRQLPSEYQRFEHVDQEMKDLFADARPSLFGQESSHGCLEIVLELRDLQVELEICQKALNQYLDGKKDIFPRFYFVSNASLLEILSNGNYPPRIQPHFGNCFDGIQSFEFINIQSTSESKALSEGCTSARKVTSVPSSTSLEERFLALAMISKEGEVVQFMDSHLIHGTVENWFNDLVFVMQDTLRQKIFDAVETSVLWGVDCARHTWVFDYPAQVALLGSQIVWTEEVESALEEFENGTEDAIKKYYDVSTIRLEELIKLVQGQLGALNRQKIITLITVDVHARDVVQSLITKKVSSSLDFQWQSQLRYYTTPVVTNAGQKKEVHIKICDFRSFYSYEYTGNCGRLVITPLTDRCYVTLTTALRLCLGG
ncbi:Dynein heavy chain, partial [Phytophthora palmivora]